MKQILSLVFLLSTVLSQTKWSLDAAHSTVGFSITHMVISDVQGKFDRFSGTIRAEDDEFKNAVIEVEIEPASINTGNAKRDGHLKSKDFFDVKNFPKMTFTSKSLEKISGNKYKLSGHLLMHGIRKDVELLAELKGIVKDPWGNTRAGFKAEGKLMRYDFGLKYNSALEAGGLVIGKEVTIHLNLEFIKAKS